SRRAPMQRQRRWGLLTKNRDELHTRRVETHLVSIVSSPPPGGIAFLQLVQRYPEVELIRGRSGHPRLLRRQWGPNREQGGECQGPDQAMAEILESMVVHDGSYIAAPRHGCTGEESPARHRPEQKTLGCCASPCAADARPRFFA